MSFWCLLCTVYRVIFALDFLPFYTCKWFYSFLNFPRYWILIHLKKILNLPRIKFALWQCGEKGNNKARTNISLYTGIHWQHVFWYVIKHVLYRRNTWRKNSPICEATCLSQSVACKFQHVSACMFLELQIHDCTYKCLFCVTSWNHNVLESWYTSDGCYSM